MICKANKGVKSDKTTGNMREAWFYGRIAPEMNKNGLNCPSTMLNIFDVQSTKYITFMDMLPDVTEAHKGKLEWVKTLDADGMPTPATADTFPMEKVMTGIAEQAAIMHAQHWNDQELISKAKSMLWHAQFRFGEGQKAYEGNTKMMKFCQWAMKNVKKTYRLQYPLGAQAADNCIAHTTWDNFQKLMKEDPTFTLIHGDFHLKNMMWNESQNKMSFIDFEFV